MTIARDIRTGAVVGQVTRYTSALASANPYRRAGALTLLTREGYVQVPRSSVRLEDVR
jgi:hypothetical protein